MMESIQQASPYGWVLSRMGEIESAGQSWFVTVGNRELERAYRLACFLLGDAAEAEDATQDALTHAWSQRDQLRSIDRAQAWFDRIVVNVCRARLRRRRSSVRWLSSAEPAAALAAEDPFVEALARDVVLRGLERLDADHRIVVVLRYWADLPLEVIAQRLGVPTGTVKSRLHYALASMRTALGEPSALEETAR